jgi:hypothetical protein
MSNYPVRLNQGTKINATLAGTVAPRKFIQLTDVNMIGVADGDLVTYDEATKTFVPRSSLAIDFPDEVSTLYVGKHGDDTKSGKTIEEAKLTIEAAVGISSVGTVIRISPGTYTINNPVTLPDQVSLVGYSLREVSIACSNTGDVFYVGNGNYIAEMSFVGAENSGAIVSFDPNTVRYINQSPYIQNCTNFIPNSIGMKVDGRYAIGPIKSMVLDSYTQFNQNGIGVSITNSGYAQLVSLFTICDNIAVYCGSGGACDLTNSNSSFGNYGLVADGLGPLQYVGVVTQTEGINSDTFEIQLTSPTLNITNAVYDNTTGILTAFTSTPHNFSIGMGVSLAGLAFTCTSGPGIVTYPSGNKGTVFQTLTVGPGRYLDAYDSIQANRREIQDKSLAEIAVQYTGYANTNFYFPGETETNSRSRYYDATRLVQKNKQEIVDKSLLSIAVGFSSGFKFPDDPIPYERNRYYDASRLITLNRQEIVDKSLAAVAIAHSDFYFPNDSQTNIRSRYYDAYRLIQKNKDVIVDIVWTATSNAYPSFNYTQTKCKRDIGFFIDAISTDVFTGGNSYSRNFVLQYFNGASPIGIGASEREPSVYAFTQTREKLKQAITNTLVGAAYSDLTLTPDPITGSNTNSNSCANVQSNIDTLVGIVTASIGAGNTSSLSFTPNYGYFNLSVGVGSTVSPGGLKCARDLAFLVEALSTDIFTGGNRYSRNFTLQYFDKNGNPIANGLVGETIESITAFNALRDYSKKAVTNQLNYKEVGISSGPANYTLGGPNIQVLPSGNVDSCTDVQQAINSLVGIVTTVIGIGTTSFLSTFSENLGISTTNKCARDLGYLVDAISTDIFTGGNKYSRDFTKQYFNGNNNLIYLNGENQQSVYSFKAVAQYSKKAVTNELNYKELNLSVGYSTYSSGIGSTQPILPSGNPNACMDVQSNIDNLVGIVTTVIGVGTNGNIQYLNTFNENTGTFTEGASKCLRDIGYIIDAVSTDVRDYTSRNSITATQAYFKSDGTLISNGILGEIEQTIVTFNKSRDLMKLAITNNLNNKNLSLIIDPLTGSNTSPSSCADVQSFINNLVGIITTRLNTGNLNVNPLPSVSSPSTEFSAYVGISTLSHRYYSGGTAKLNIVRPFDGQVAYFDQIYYSVNKVKIVNGGSGYTSTPVITIDPPSTSWGISAQAVATVRNGSIVEVDLVSSGRGYTSLPKVSVSSPNSGINTSVISIDIIPSYYSIQKSTEVSSGISTITINENVPYSIGSGTKVYFYKQSRVLASGHSLEYIGSGTDIKQALPFSGGVPIQDNEVDMRNGGLVVYTSTDQSGNFRIGDGVIINQQTGNISGNSYSKSLFSQMTPYILALGGD